MPEITADQRAAIFELRGRTPPISYAKIAGQLDIPESAVYREHKRVATPDRTGVSVGIPPRREGGDRESPEVEAARARLEIKKLELAEKQMDRQLALMDGKSGGAQEGAMAMVLLEQMRRMQDDVERRLTTFQAPKPAEDPMTAMVKGMGMLAEIQQKAQLLAPPAPVSAGASLGDLEARVAMERVRIESEALTRKATSEAERNAFILGAAKENLPLIIAGLQKAFENIGKRPLPEARPTLTVMPGGQTVAETELSTEIPMTCASCQSKFRVNPEPGEIPTCTLCGGPLQPDIPPPAPKAAWPEDAIFG